MKIAFRHLNSNAGVWWNWGIRLLWWEFVCGHAGPSQTSTQAHLFFRSREWTPPRRWTGTLERGWPMYTRPRPRKMDPCSVVFGARLPAHTVTVELSVPDSGVTCLPLHWYAQIFFRFRFGWRRWWVQVETPNSISRLCEFLGQSPWKWFWMTLTSSF